MQNKNKQILKLIAEIQALSQSGLAFTKNEFDIERYNRLTEISAHLASFFTDKSVGEITEFFSLEKGYATPKIDVRSFVLRDDKVLLVKERSDGLWTLPGGFADVAESPSQAVIRETKEESGFDVSVIKLLALWDKFKHDHPLHWPHIYKCFFQCEYISGSAQENLEIAEIDFFSISNLPPLSVHRVTATQIQRLYDLVKAGSATVFD